MAKKVVFKTSNGTKMPVGVDSAGKIADIKFLTKAQESTAQNATTDNVLYLVAES